MNATAKPGSANQPAKWAIVLAFALLYLSWGTTFLAIRKGVETLPPASFGGSRVALAGLALLAYLGLRGESLRLARREFFGIGLVGLLLFVGGNGLLTVAEQFVPSGLASILAATAPLWMALLEALWPWGERLKLQGWLGLLVGLGGVAVLLAPRLDDPAIRLGSGGPLLVLGSALCWSVGSVLSRHRRLRTPHLKAAAYQMALGGGSLLAVGLVLGEGRQLAWERFTPVAIYAFIHLLLVGSLVGFVAYNWLLGHVSAPLAGTHAYVNPMIAMLIGWLVNGEAVNHSILGGMAIILLGVALVRGGGVRSPYRKDENAVLATDGPGVNGPAVSNVRAAHPNRR